MGWRFLYAVVFVFMLAITLVAVANPNAEAANGKSIVGAWYVDTVGAPFVPHGITFHADGTLDLTNPDAAEAQNSSSAGMGAWVVTANDNARGRFFEVNADKTTNEFTSILVVTFEFTVTGDRFSGPAIATYFDGNQNIIAGPFPATLEGQRFTVDGPIPDPIES